MAVLHPAVPPALPALARVSFFEQSPRYKLATLGGIALGACILYLANREMAKRINFGSKTLKEVVIASCCLGVIGSVIRIIVLLILKKKPSELIPTAILGLSCLYQALAVDFKKAKKSPRPHVSLEEIANVGGAKEQVENILRIMQAYRPQGLASAVKFPTALLFYGPPGTGKTLLSSALVTSVSREYTVYRHVLASNLVNRYVGTGANAITDIFREIKTEIAELQAKLDEARKAGIPDLPSEVRAFVYFEEMDSLRARPERGSAGGGHEYDTMINTLLGEIDKIIQDKIPITVMGSTNRRDAVDPAILSRIPLNYQIHVPAPNESERLEILQVHFRNVPLGSSVDLSKLAKQTAGYVGRELRDLVQAAINKAAIRGADQIEAEDISVLEGARTHDKMPQYHEAAQTIVRSKFVQTCPGCPDTSESYYKARLRYLLAPIVIEELLVGANGGILERTSHVESSLTQATELAKKMVCDWRMAGDNLPFASSMNSASSLSLELQIKIEDAVSKLISKEQEETQQLLSKELDQIKRTVEGPAPAILLS